jgi:membrane protein implicated in regulation of membrane protease activity
MFADLALGLPLVAVGIVILVLELIHPGALLFIPGSALIAAGFLSLFGLLTASPVGPIVIVVVAAGAGIAEIPYYQWVAPTHRPMTSTSAGFEGQFATVTAPIVPNTLKGKVRIGSEIWSAQSDYPIPVGTRVRIVGGSGVSVRVVVAEPPPPP